MRGQHTLQRIPFLGARKPAKHTTPRCVNQDTLIETLDLHPEYQHDQHAHTLAKSHKLPHETKHSTTNTHIDFYTLFPGTYHPLHRTLSAPHCIASLWTRYGVPLWKARPSLDFLIACTACFCIHNQPVSLFLHWQGRFFMSACCFSRLACSRGV
ncbi:hypothetical protein BDV97DRAFT_31614 [Delphinella strobiligena]|nr:hypothetical protein BDV97DRAFT_31614 [Delphinella strobiligena]